MSSKRDVSFKAIRFNVVRGVKRNFCTAMEVRREESNQKCFYVLFTFYVSVDARHVRHDEDRLPQPEHHPGRGPARPAVVPEAEEAAAQEAKALCGRGWRRRQDQAQPVQPLRRREVQDDGVPHHGAVAAAEPAVQVCTYMFIISMQDQNLP